MDKATERMIDRFLDKVNTDNDEGCMIWTGAVSSSGYGEITVDGRPEGAHRMSYRLFIGDVPKGMCVCHTCDNPLCVAPRHLFLGTNKDNMADMVSKGRSAKGEQHGRARLKIRDIVEIRRKYATGEYSQQQLADRYSVSQRQISYIVNRKTWAHLGSGGGL